MCVDLCVWNDDIQTDSGLGLWWEQCVDVCVCVCAWKISKWIGALALWWEQYVELCACVCVQDILMDRGLGIRWDQRMDMCICVSEEKKKKGYPNSFQKGPCCCDEARACGCVMSVCASRSYPKWILQGALGCEENNVWHNVHLFYACWDLAKGEKLPSYRCK